MTDTDGASLRAASSINDLRTQSLSKIVQRLGTLDLTPLLIYTISNVPDSVLPFLAWQFDMLAPWWQIFTDGASQRELVQQAIALHRFQGTPFAIEKIASHLGFALVTLEEGQASWGGTSWPADAGWAVFRVLISKAHITPAANPPTSWDTVTNLDLLIEIDTLQQAQTIDGLSVSSREQLQLVSAIEFFKPARCWLDSVWIQEIPRIEPPFEVTDRFTLSAGPNIIEPPGVMAELIVTPANPLADLKKTVPLYDTHFYYAGITYGDNEPAIVDSGVTINA